MKTAAVEKAVVGCCRELAGRWPYGTRPRQPASRRPAAVTTPAQTASSSCDEVASRHRRRSHRRQTTKHIKQHKVTHQGEAPTSRLSKLLPKSVPISTALISLYCDFWLPKYYAALSRGRVKRCIPPVRPVTTIYSKAESRKSLKFGRVVNLDTSNRESKFGVKSQRSRSMGTKV